MERRSIDVDDHLRPRRALRRRRTDGVPDVFADVDSYGRSVDDVHGAGDARAKVTVFIEHAVVGQELLMIDVDDPPAVGDGRGVVHFSGLEVGETDDDGYPVRRRGDALHAPPVLL